MSVFDVLKGSSRASKYYFKKLDLIRLKVGQKIGGVF